MIEADPDKFIRELEEEQADLKKLRDAAKSSAALFFKVTNTALTDVLATKKGVAASEKAYKSGVNKHSESAIKAAAFVMQSNDNLYQLGLILDHIQKTKEQEENQ